MAITKNYFKNFLSMRCQISVYLQLLNLIFFQLFYDFMRLDKTRKITRRASNFSSEHLFLTNVREFQTLKIWMETKTCRATHSTFQLLTNMTLIDARKFWRVIKAWEKFLINDNKITTQLLAMKKKKKIERKSIRIMSERRSNLDELALQNEDIVGRPGEKWHLEREECHELNQL